ncbi:scribbler isoform X2 [Musca autumnalis]
MSSQTVNNNNSGTNVGSGGVGNANSGQSGSSNSNKSNTKMSIDHQATLDKGLKMKIKRTKPGTKSSEAKHEIVKATEQQQNGIPVGSIGNSTEESTTSISSANSNPPTQSSGGSTSTQNVTSNGNKKSLNNNATQLNNFSSGNNNTNNMSSGILSSSIQNQTNQMGPKRTSSGHRREKVKDKTLHSNRNINEKNISPNMEKEVAEKNVCKCNNSDNSVSTCSSSVCIRRNEGSVQRLSSTNTTVPPGVFTPSTEAPTVAVSAAALLSVSSPVASSLSSTMSGAANTPGPPNKDSNSGGNIKISSHIAAQLAAAAASVNGSFMNTTDINMQQTNNTDHQNKTAPGLISATIHHSISIPLSNKTNDLPMSANLSSAMTSKTNASADECSKSPPPKRAKPNDGKVHGSNFINKETVDICIGTSVGTITEPDCLGPCEPGTSVTLEGIVWHETEGGVLVVNVTWRGKTYVGTLLDCTRHDWAPPRFCDSPSEELDSRTPKGRGKRGRAVTTPDLSNFTETRSSIYFSHPHVHSKLRNGSTKGGRGNSRSSSSTEKSGGGSSVSSGNGGSTPSTSPTAFLPPRAEKRKSKDEPASPLNTDNEILVSPLVNASGIPISVSGGGLTNQPQSLINPVTGLNVQINTKKINTTPCAISPILLECPEQDCSKKYKHANGLRYHQSHAHGSVSMVDDDSIADIDDSNITPIHSPVCLGTTSNESEAIETVSTLNVTQPSTLKISDPSKLSQSNFPEPEAESSASLLTANATENDSEIISTTSGDILHNTPTQSNCSKIANATNNNSELTLGQRTEVHENDIDVNTVSKMEQSSELRSEQNHSDNAGVLRFGQAESNERDSILVTVENEETLNQIQQDGSTREPCKESTQQVQKSELLCENKESLANSNSQENNQSSKSPITGKQKKVRKSPGPPGPSEFDVDGFNTCNIPSREEVQSPAYSDISDDSTPVNELQILQKPVPQKNTDSAKKSPDTVLSSGSVCTSNVQTSVQSSLSGYGVYQFYQQQQFLGQPSIEQQSNKNCLMGNAAQQSITVSCTSQQMPKNIDVNRKDPPLDLMTKPVVSTMPDSSPSPHDSNKDSSQVQNSTIPNQVANSLPVGSSAINSSGPSKSVSHFYAFNYMSPSYPFNVDQNYTPIPIAADDGKGNRHSGTLSPNDQQHNSIVFKDDRGNDINSPTVQQQNTLNKAVKSEGIPKTENLKAESANMNSSQISQIPSHNKDMQGMGSYSNIYQRHPMALSSQQLSREEELRRYYIFSDQQRRQNNTTSSVNMNNQNQGCSNQCKDDSLSAQGNPTSQQQQIKTKQNITLNISNKHMLGAKESPPKQKQDEDIKVIKQEGQKPTMETQGPPPPPTSQYFLHPSYIAPTPFGFDPNHPMYRNVLMPPASPYNTAPYHLPLPRYHAPEDLSRNTGAKALDVLHHAASQYYTTHKIHELSERALKSPNNNSNGPNTVKVSVSSPSLSTTQHSTMNSNTAGHHPNTTQSTSSSQLPHNLSHTMPVASNKAEVSGQKSQVSGSNVGSVTHSESQKSQTSNSSVISSSTVANVSASGGPDSRSPPPQRHVHTHHHTHVGLGYPMYPAPYGAAVLASQQAAAVAVINPFPPGPTK